MSRAVEPTHCWLKFFESCFSKLTSCVSSSKSFISFQIIMPYKTRKALISALVFEGIEGYVVPPLNVYIHASICKLNPGESIKFDECIWKSLLQALSLVGTTLSSPFDGLLVDDMDQKA